MSRALACQQVAAALYAAGAGRPSSQVRPERAVWYATTRREAEAGRLHAAAARMAQHLTWYADTSGRLGRIAELIVGYASRCQVSERTGWKDLRRLVDAGWVRQTRLPANKGPAGQGLGTGQGARWVVRA